MIHQCGNYVDLKAQGFYRVTLPHSSQCMLWLKFDYLLNKLKTSYLVTSDFSNLWTVRFFYAYNEDVWIDSSSLDLAFDAVNECWHPINFTWKVPSIFHYVTVAISWYCRGYCSCNISSTCRWYVDPSSTIELLSSVVAFLPRKVDTQA